MTGIRRVMRYGATFVGLCLLFACVGLRPAVAATPPTTITTLSRYSDATTGGASLTITGTNFGNIVGVAFGDASATNIIRKSATELVVGVPSHAEGRVGVVVVRDDGMRAELPGGFIYVRPGFAAYEFAQTWYGADLAVLRGTATTSWLYGPQTYLGQAELYKEAPNNLRLVQYFDKARLELTERSADPYAASAGLLTNELVSGKRQEGDATFVSGQAAQVPVAGDGDDPTGPTYATFTNLATLPGAPYPVAQNSDYIGSSIARDGTISQLAGAPPIAARNAYYIRETGHNIPDVFINWLNRQSNWIGTMGFPITEAYWATVKVGGVQKTVLMQLYERRALTFTASNSPQYQVEYGNIGLHYYRWRYGRAPMVSAYPAPHNADGIWRGMTNQGRKIFFTVENNSATTLLYTFDGARDCQNAYFGSNFAKRHDIIENSFGVSITGSDGTRSEVGVDFQSDDTATGTIHHQSGSDFAGCGDLALTFRATKDAPTEPSLDGVWSGTTAQGDPIRLTVVHRAVRSVSFPFNKSGCAPDTAAYSFLDYYQPRSITGNTLRLDFNIKDQLLFTLAANFGGTLAGTLKTTVSPPPGYTSPCAGTQTVEFSASRQTTNATVAAFGLATKDEVGLNGR